MQLTVKDRTFTLYVGPELAKDLENWARAKLPCPLEMTRAALKDFPTELHAALVKDAMNQKRAQALKGFSDPEIQAVLQTAEGIERQLCAMLQRAQPDMSVSDCWRFHTDAIREHGSDYLSTLQKA
jgi:hypothetical protein